jgi:tetratricopeptide (TPR) repeat protein
VPILEAELQAFNDARTVAEAERALDAMRELDPPDDLELGELYDELASVAADDGDFDMAVRLQAAALELGCRHRELGRDMLAWYLLKAGRQSEGERQFELLLAERGGDDVHTLLTLGHARSDAGLSESALAAYDEALRAAERTGAEEDLADARRERREWRQEMGLDLDADDLLVPPPRRFARETIGSLALAWFPRAEHAAALARWPDLEDDLRDPDEYCWSIERELRDMRALATRAPSIAVLDLDELIAFADRERLDAGTGAARSRYAAEVARLGAGLPWPPSRNDPCWCGSGRKYKRCCATA